MEDVHVVENINVAGSHVSHVEKEHSNVKDSDINAPEVSNVEVKTIVGVAKSNEVVQGSSVENNRKEAVVEDSLSVRSRVDDSGVSVQDAQAVDASVKVASVKNLHLKDPSESANDSGTKVAVVQTFHLEVPDKTRDSTARDSNVEDSRINEPVVNVSSTKDSNEESEKELKADDVPIPSITDLMIDEMVSDSNFNAIIDLNLHGSLDSNLFVG